MFTTVELLTVDNCHKKVDLPVWHISVEGERYFNNQHVEQHFGVIFKEYHSAVSVLDNHAPSVIATKEEAAPLIPQKIRDVLAQN
jgi:hypothetical protein